AAVNAAAIINATNRWRCPSDDEWRTPFLLRTLSSRRARSICQYHARFLVVGAVARMPPPVASIGCAAVAIGSQANHQAPWHFADQIQNIAASEASVVVGLKRRFCLLAKTLRILRTSPDPMGFYAFERMRTRKRSLTRRPT